MKITKNDRIFQSHVASLISLVMIMINTDELAFMSGQFVFLLPR